MLACAVAAILVAGCSSGGDNGTGGGGGEPGEPKKGAAPGALESQWMQVRNWIRVDLLSLDRTSPNVVTARFKLNNTGTEEYDVGDDLGITGFGTNESDLRGISLVDTKARKRYYPLMGTDQKCVCSYSEDRLKVEPGKSLELFASFPAPPSEAVTFIVSNTPPFQSIPVGDKQGPVTPPPGQEARDATKLELDDPRILPILGFSETVDGSKEEVEDDKKVEVRLSADVLFALNKANLSPKAQSVLEDVAARIDASKATTVKVDGYTDSSGNDAINIPLSKRRAQAVHKALAELVTKDVTYTVAGHGSDDPVAPNDSEENRKRNRRVSVTFAR